MNEWWPVYLLGCFAAIVVMLANTAVFYSVGWLRKSNIVARNLKKIFPPDRTPFATKLAKGAAFVALEIALSWIAVAAGAWKLLRFVLETMREVLSPPPEAVRKIAYPLKCNPDMSREAVWAHTLSIGALTGDSLAQPEGICEALSEVSAVYDDFDKELALRLLRGLNVVAPDVIDESVRKFEETEETEDAEDAEEESYGEYPETDFA
jgi:hypothetical protein